jgi:putative heme iron utilization protein
MDNDSKKILIHLIEYSKIASLGTSSNNQPFISMVAYSVNEKFSEFYILISQLAKHSKNITDNKKISLMICQPETEADNPQTLARVSVTGIAQLIERNSEEYNSAKNSYLIKNTNAEMYFRLGDFQLYKLRINKARFVAGFAKTFNLSKESLQNLKK